MSDFLQSADYIFVRSNVKKISRSAGLHHFFYNIECQTLCTFLENFGFLMYFSNGEIISSAIFCSNLASDGKLGERSVAGYTTADALPSRTRDG